jgi:hypothetical protein
MEERFVQIGIEDADKLRELNPGHEFPAELADLCADWSWNWFVADMSDDYSKTLGEQRALRNAIHQRLGDDINYPYAWR